MLQCETDKAEISWTNQQGVSFKATYEGSSSNKNHEGVYRQGA